MIYRLIFTCLVFLNGPVRVYAQSPAGHWIFSFYMSDQNYQKLIQSRGQKIDIYPKKATLNNQPLNIDYLHVRGKSSLNFRRKSFTVHLAGDTLFNYDDESRKANKFYLLSLSMDRNYFRNRLAFLCLKDLGLFPLFNDYAEVVINGESQGIYLLMEKPEEYVLKNTDGIFIMRRGEKDIIHEFKSGNDISRETEKRYIRLYKSINKICRKEKGPALQSQLSALLDLEAYMKWLAFNFWVSNGDYDDEVFLYVAHPNANPVFTILPWDYDDIFVSSPHEGWELRNRRIGEVMIFSSEDILGRAIANDTLMYRQYLQVLKSVMEQFSEERLRGIFDQVYSDLKLFYSNPENLRMTQYDLGGAYNTKTLYQDIESKYNLMITRRRKYLAQIK